MKKHILFIGNDQLLGETLAQKIQDEGYDVNIVRDGAEGLKQIGIQKPNLILLEMTLPTMNGYEILEERKKDLALSEIPVITVSNANEPMEVDRALALGVKDYLIKGQFNSEDVLARIRTYLGNGDIKKIPPTSRLSKEKLLWIEDDQFLSNILGTKLAHEGGSVLYAKDGEEALEIVTHEVPDIILLDLLLPGLTGFEVLQAIRANERVARVPVIVLSNLGQKADMDKCKELGANKYLIKAEHDLEDIISEILKTLNETKAPSGATNFSTQ